MPLSPSVMNPLPGSLTRAIPWHRFKPVIDPTDVSGSSCAKDYGEGGAHARARISLAAQEAS